MVYIIAIRQSGGSQHEHITDVKWEDSTTKKTGQMTRAAAVEWIEKGNSMWVSDGQRTVSVRVVQANSKYLRTYADGVPTDNLLALPRF